MMVNAFSSPVAAEISTFTLGVHVQSSLASIERLGFSFLNFHFSIFGPAVLTVDRK